MSGAGVLSSPAPRNCLALSAGRPSSTWPRHEPQFRRSAERTAGRQAISKTGPGFLTVSGTNNTFTAGTNFNVTAGSLVEIGQNYTAGGPATGPLGSAPITLTNAGLVLGVSTTGATATFDLTSGNPLTLSGSNNSIFAGSGGVGAVNGTVILAGSNVVNVTTGKTLNLGSSNGYTLSVDPSLAFDVLGTINASAGSVSMQSSSLQAGPYGTVTAASGGTLTVGGPVNFGTFSPGNGGTVVLSGSVSTGAYFKPAPGGTVVSSGT